MRKTLETSTALTGGQVNQYVDLGDLEAKAKAEAFANGREIVGGPRLSVRTITLAGDEITLLATEWDTEEIG